MVGVNWLQFEVADNRGKVFRTGETDRAQRRMLVGNRILIELVFIANSFILFSFLRVGAPTISLPGYPAQATIRRACAFRVLHD